ncbi:N-acetylmuramoyl-L-alanine amidase [candidate division KSB1 bacterium]|nr:N-acetylmuramoyl-L-alanine amidase [candidate division KSB1 bacterium]
MHNFYRNILIIWLLQLAFQCPTYAQSVAVKYRNLNQPETSLPTVEHNNVIFVSLYRFAGVLNGATHFDNRTKKLTLTLEEVTIVATAFNPFVLVGNNMFQMTSETLLQDNDFLVPLNDFSAIITRFFPDRVYYDKATNTLEISEFRNTNILSIQIEQKANGNLIRMVTTRRFAEADVRLRDRHGWLYADIYGGRVDSVALSQTTRQGIVRQIVPQQVSDKTAQIGFRLTEPVLEKQVYVENPYEILITLKTKNNIADELSSELERERKKWLLDKIVIDPGHGGKDPGAVGKFSYEKDITLAIAFKLRKLIQERTKIQVLMTREDDRLPKLKDRTEFANRNQAKLFISIHVNANPSRRLHGVSTYFLGPEKSDEAREVALLENSVIKYESESQYDDLSNENFILSTMAQNVYNFESEDLAAMVQQELATGCDLTDLGVRQGNFWVLLGASMPNIIVETAFISNRQEEKRLNSAEFQQQVAEAIFNGIMKFKQKYEKGI